MKNQEVKEVWVPCKYIKDDGTVLSFEKYECSSLGRVRSLNYNQTGKTKVLSQCEVKGTDGTIYYILMLCLNSKRYTLTVHRLVLSSFKESEYFPGAVCDHIDARTETSCCNCLDNLHWVTQQQNASTERCKTLKSNANTNHPSYSKRVKVTDLTTGETAVYPSASEAGRSLGINPKVPTICINQCKGYYKKLNLRFEYV